jgi:3-hydroxyisobutyrate dehydrogenase-like beta-hydroxyacid dehydrogenase
MSIGFIGAGQLGEPMVKRLLSAGHLVHVYARRPDVRERLSTLGAAITESVAETAAACDVLICCVFSDEQLQRIALGPQGFLAHANAETVLVSHTTGDADTLVALANERDDVHVVDAPVSGTAQDIASGKLTVLLGGPAPAVRRVRPLLAAYAAPIIETGALGSGLKIKLVNNLLFAANVQILAAATLLSSQLGVEAGRWLDAVAVCSGASRAAEFARQYGGVQALGHAIGPVIHKDVDACVAAAQRYRADVGLLATLVESGPLSYPRKAR